MRSILTIIAAAIAWHLLVNIQLIDSAFYPSPFAVIKNLGTLLTDQYFLMDIWSSFGRLFVAITITFPLAIFFAAACAKFNIVDQIFNPIVALTFPLPKVAIFPLMLLVFGIDEKSKIALISVGIFYPVFINSRIGFKKLISGKTAEILAIYPLKRLDFIYHYLLKGAQLEILTGMKLAVNYGLTLVVVSETTTSNNGIGYYIWRSWDQFKLINVYSGVYFLSLTGFFLYYSFDYLITHQRKKFFT